MNKTEHYVFGKSRVPPWVGNILSDITYDLQGNVIRASVPTMHGVKRAKEGDVLMRVNGRVVLLNKNDAKKYGVTR